MKRMLAPTAAALGLLAGGPALAQDGDDCAFLERAFEEAYSGAQEESAAEDFAPEVVTMYATFQTNVLLMAQAAECDVSPMIATARQKLRQYDDAAEGEPAE